MKKLLGLRALTQSFLLSIVFVLANGCDAFLPILGAKKIEKKTVNIVSLASPFSKTAKSDGLEHDFIAHFAEEFGLVLNWRLASSTEEAISQLKSGKADIAIGRFSHNLAHFNGLLSGPLYEESSFSLICLKIKPERPLVLGLKKDIDPLTEQRLRKQHPEWNLKISSRQSVRSLIKQTKIRKQSCLLLEQNEARFYHRLLPQMHEHPLQKFKTSVAFLISSQRPELQKYLFHWHQRATRNQEIARIQDRYYGYLGGLDSQDRKFFYRTLQSDLYWLGPLFKKYAREYQLPWELVAAVAFQESHWNSTAISPTGVQGIMMLTNATAAHMGVDDRTDVEQSLRGGTQYLRYLLQQQPKFLPERERLSFALAAYNVGPGHLRDAQKIALQLGKNPHSWRDMKAVLPLLSDPKYYSQTQFGQARGHEPVDYVNRVLGYWDLMTQRI